MVGGRQALVALAGLLAAAGALAHRLPESLTSIGWNPDTERTEIVHRLHGHDAELAVSRALGEPGLRLAEMEGRAKLALYVERRFVIAPLVEGQPGEPLALELVGVELDGQWVLVYQEYPGRLHQPLALRDDILRDAFADQVNQVNLALADGLHTLYFRGEDSWRSP